MTESESQTNLAPVLNAFAPIGAANARLLVLGSMPGAVSLFDNEYYAHPRNAFWPVMQALFGQGSCGTTDSYAEKCRLLTDNRIAVWDVLTQCIRPGSLDANIRKDSVVCNDFAAFLESQPDIAAIAFNGKAAEQLFRKYVLPALDLSIGSDANNRDPSKRQINLISLPSTSPAMASLTLDDKILAWGKALLHTVDKGLALNDQV